MAATNDTEAISAGTVAGLFQFLDYLVDKGYAPSGTVRPWRIASRKVFEAMEEADGTSILDIDVDDYMDRFANKERHKYKAESIAAYRTRFRRAMEGYRAYLTEGSEWKPPSIPTRASRTRSGPTRNGPITAEDAITLSDTATVMPVAATPSTLLDYPFPLSTGDLAHLRLPRGLTPKDAERIGAFVKTLALEPASDSPDGRGDA